jgi:hypothetical protein
MYKAAALRDVQCGADHLSSRGYATVFLRSLELRNN